MEESRSKRNHTVIEFHEEEPRNDPMLAFAQGLIALGKFDKDFVKAIETEYKFSFNDPPQIAAKRLRETAKFLIEAHMKEHQEMIFDKYIKNILRYQYNRLDRKGKKNGFSKACLGADIVNHDLLRNQLMDYQGRELTTAEYLELADKIKTWWNEKGFKTFMEHFSENLCGLELVPLLRTFAPIVVFFRDSGGNHIVASPFSDNSYADLTNDEMRSDFFTKSFFLVLSANSTFSNCWGFKQAYYLGKDYYLNKPPSYYEDHKEQCKKVAGLFIKAKSSIPNIVLINNLLNSIKEPTPDSKYFGDISTRIYAFIAGAAGTISSLLTDSHSTFGIPSLFSPITSAAASLITLSIATTSNISTNQKRDNISPEVRQLLELLTFKISGKKDKDVVMINIDQGDVHVLEPDEKKSDFLKKNYVSLGHLSSLKALKPAKRILTPYFKQCEWDPEIYLPTVIIQVISLYAIGVGVALAFPDAENWAYMGPSLGLVIAGLIISVIFEFLSDFTAHAEDKLRNLAIESVGGKDFYNHEVAIYNEFSNLYNHLVELNLTGIQAQMHDWEEPANYVSSTPQDIQHPVLTAHPTLENASVPPQSTSDMVSITVFGRTWNLSRTPLHNANKIKNLLQSKCHMPDHFQLGTAINLFDAVAQGLNQLKPNAHFDIKSLHSFCTAYTKDPKNKNSWLTSEVFTVHGITFDRYLNFISSLEEMENGPIVLRRYPIRPEIEGRMICDKYGIKLHIIEVIDRAYNGSVILEQMIESTEPHPTDIPTIHLATYQGHFVPLLLIAPRLMHTQQLAQSADGSLSPRNTSITNNRYTRSFSQTDTSNNNTNYTSPSMYPGGEQV